ncbi:MAG: hypothetical protein HN403_05430 [Rhodospirillales bacterium]|jgi:hypothetical protein|nr:hypothetical protein [Rhodospirillales bacterium]
MKNGLRAVFVNHSHPDKKHVSALRLTSFARVLAARGHKIVLFTETLNPDDPAPSVTQTQTDLGGHDWTQPFVLPCPPKPAPLLARARVGGLGFGARQCVLGASYLFRSGVFTDWQEGARRYFPVLDKSFRPQIVWGTFGNTDAWNIARGLADLSGCPWIADVKDNWSAFLPRGFARLIAARYRDAAHMTVYSEGHRDEADRWFSQNKTVIYSGFNEDSRPPIPQEPAQFRILLTGSIYDDACLARLIGGIRDWLPGFANDVVFSYAGNDGERVKRQAQSLQGLCEIDIRDFLAYDELIALQKASSINVYIHNPRSLFQHKTLELLAPGVPVIAIPGESREAVRIADEMGGRLLLCDTQDQVCSALQKISADARPTVDIDKMNAYSWQAQAGNLTRIFERVIGGGA